MTAVYRHVRMKSARKGEKNESTGTTGYGLALQEVRHKKEDRLILGFVSENSCRHLFLHIETNQLKSRTSCIEIVLQTESPVGEKIYCFKTPKTKYITKDCFELSIVSLPISSNSLLTGQ